MIIFEIWSGCCLALVTIGALDSVIHATRNRLTQRRLEPMRTDNVVRLDEKRQLRRG